MNLGMTVTGAKEMEKMMTRLERKDAAKIVRKNLTISQNKIMKPAVQSKAMSVVGGEMGALIASKLVSRAMTKMRKGSYGRKVIIKADDAFVHETKAGVRYFIPTAIEYGHAFPGYGRGGYMALGMTESQARKSAAKNKDVAPRSFQRSAYEEKRRSLAVYFAAKVTRAIEQAARVK